MKKTRKVFGLNLSNYDDAPARPLFAGRQLQWTTQSVLHMTAGHTVATGAPMRQDSLRTRAGSRPPPATCRCRCRRITTSSRYWPTRRSRWSRSTTSSTSRPTRRSRCRPGNRRSRWKGEYYVCLPGKLYGQGRAAFIFRRCEQGCEVG